MSVPPIAAILEQLVSGPPHTRALGFEWVGLEGKAAVLRLPYREDLVGDPETGVLAGGVITALLDHTCGAAVWAARDRYSAIATLDMRIDYMRAAEPGLPVWARAECYKLSRSVAFVRGLAYDRDAADPVATAQAAFMLDSDGGRRPGANRPERG